MRENRDTLLFRKILTNRYFRQKRKEEELFNIRLGDDFGRISNTLSESSRAYEQSLGYNRFEFFTKLINGGLGIQNELFQEEFLHEIAKVLAPLIVGADWQKVAPELSIRYGWNLQNMIPMLCGLTPRRTGKSTCVAEAISAFALSAPHRKIALFAVAQRISKAMGDMIFNMLQDAGFGDLVSQRDTETMTLVGESKEDQRVILTLPMSINVESCTFRIFFYALYFLCVCLCVFISPSWSITPLFVPSVFPYIIHVLK